MISGFLSTLIIPGLFLGIICIVGNWFIPTRFIQYKIPIKYLGIILVIFFTFQQGRYTEHQKNLVVQSKNELKISQLETQSAKVTTKIVTEYVDRVKIVQQIKEVPINVYIPESANATCIIDSNTSGNIARLLNDSASGKIPRAPAVIDDSTRETDPTR